MSASNVAVITDIDQAQALVQGADDRLKFQEMKQVSAKVFKPLAKTITVHDITSLNAWLVLNSPYRFTWYCAGIGTGKSYIGARYAVRRVLENWETVGMVAANSHVQLAQSTLPHLFKLLEESGFIEGKTYVYNKTPPKSWKSRNLFKGDYTHVLSIKTAVGKVAHILIRTLQNWKGIRGVTIGWGVIDEIADTKEDAWSEITERLRCELSKFLQIVILGMPALPGDNWTWEEFSKNAGGRYKIIFQSSTEAIHLKWNDYLLPLLKRLDPVRALQRVFARIVIDQTGRIYYAYKDGVNNIRKYDYDPHRPIFMCWDFNIDSSAPIACVLFQEFDNGRGDIDVQVFDEFFVEGGNTIQVCEMFMLKYALKHKSSIWVWGDVSGRSSQTITEFSLIKKCLNNPAPHILAQLAEKVPQVLANSGLASFRKRLFIPNMGDVKINPPVEFRIAAINAKFRNTLGVSTMFIDPEACPNTLLDCKKIVGKPGGGIDKSDIERTHCTDGLGYGVSKRFPPYDLKPEYSQYKAAV